MPLSLAQDAIAFLIDLAERGEIDPWDVKVIEVIDRFLSTLAPLSSGREPYEATLSQSGQAFLYASMLVLLKADSLSQPEPVAATDADEEMEFLDPDGVNGSALPANLERQIRRRAVAQPPQRRRVTLKELIDQLRTIATALDDPTPRARARRPRQQSRSQAVRAIAQLAHQENLSEMAMALEQFFIDNWHTIAKGETWLDFDLLLELWSQASSYKAAIPHDPHAGNVTHDRVGIFWALLLLSAQSKVELSQEEFYQDLKIQLLSEEALADLSDWAARASPD
ncbi:segregation/condensation protein A [Stenomitos frigidus]|uniref:Segregation and condensation protein A n=1 Tax=Stenomitos frigidus ULC18 TaxID=2107698 RepID=A0A2T1ER27_9CYAN|nr:segregation/condensation protein A [Stenomitos frigidus]PSB35163.1 segregation/condensation protein A [Stenomitos frigidus ULC18]